MRQGIDLSGQKFGRLTVIQRAGATKSRTWTWLCKCECGNEKTVAAGNLLSGGTKSCGCLRSELMRNRNQKYNPSRRIIVNDGKAHSIAEWAKILKVPYKLFYRRLKSHNWDIDLALASIKQEA